MAADILTRYLHFLSILILVGAVVSQHFMIRRTMVRQDVVRLQALDMVYAISAVLVLATGFLQWFAVGKPAPFYSKNGIFHAKILIFLVVGLLSIYPSVFFGRHRKGETTDVVAVPGLVIWSVRAELALLFLMPLLATLMARGIGLKPE